MRKFLSLIFALFVTLPFCTKCYAIEVDSLGDEVRHVVRQSVPANIEILDGSIQSGAAGDLEYLDQKVVLLKSGVSDAGKNCARLEVLFTGVPKTRIQSATFRLGTVNAGPLTYTISLFDWNPDNGEILWCIDAAGYPERVFWSTPEATNGLVIATGIDGKVYAVEYTH